MIWKKKQGSRERDGKVKVSSLTVWWKRTRTRWNTAQ